jgi:chromosome segregation ATPase
VTDAHLLAAAVGLVSALGLALRAAPPAFASFAKLANSLSSAVDASTKRLGELEELHVRDTETIRVLRETLDGRGDELAEVREELSASRDAIASKDRALAAARTEMAELRRSIDPKTSFKGSPL